MQSSKSLKPGRYMKVDPVSYFLCNNFPSQFKALAQLEIHPGEYAIYYSTSDLKKIMSESLFKELECECTTHLILSESDLQAYYNNELNY
jgi:hypothetical protein